MSAEGTKAVGPVAIGEWAEQNKDCFKPPICNKVRSTCACVHASSAAQIFAQRMVAETTATLLAPVDG
jgi:hypothetical protein